MQILIILTPLLIMQVPKAIVEKGCRTIVFHPNELSSCFGLASEMNPLVQPSLIGFKHNKPTVYPINNSPVQLYMQNRQKLNTVELNKVSIQAKQDKPARADQLPTESVFELTCTDINLEQKDVDFIFGNECMHVDPSSNFYIHNLFSNNGHINFEIYNQYSVSIAEQLLIKYMQHYIELIIKNAKTSQFIDNNINYDEVNTFSQNIYNLQTKRTIIQKENIPLFHKKRQLNSSQYPSDFSNYLLLIVIPDDCDAIELKLLTEIAFDRLGFEGLQFIPESQLYLLYNGNQQNASLILNADYRQSKIICQEPHHPVIHNLNNSFPITLIGLFSGFQYFLQNCQELVQIKQLFGVFLQGSLDVNQQLELFKNIIPTKLYQIYQEQNDLIKQSIVDCFIFQININVNNLFQSKIISLNPEDNKQFIFQLLFPTLKVQLEQIDIVGVKVSYMLGYVGLATARLLFNVQAIQQNFFSQKHLPLNFFIPKTKIDPITIQRDIQKTTKVQLTPEELERTKYLDREVFDDINIYLIKQQNQQYTNQINQKIKIDLPILIKQFTSMLENNIFKNEKFLREMGKNAAPAEAIKINIQQDHNPDDQANVQDTEQTNADQETKSTQMTEAQVASTVVRQLCGNIIMCGILGSGINHFQEYLINMLNTNIQSNSNDDSYQYTTVVDQVINDYLKHNNQKQNLLFGLGCLMSVLDSSIECFVSKEEYQNIGCRIFIEKSSFFWP